MGFCSKGLKIEFETAVVNEPSVFEPLKFYCIWTIWLFRDLKTADAVYSGDMTELYMLELYAVDTGLERIETCNLSLFTQVLNEMKHVTCRCLLKS